MSDDSVQNFANHARWLKPWHFFAVPVLAINAIVSLVTLAKGPSLGTLWASLVAIALAVAVFLCRWMPLQVQDRVIRLEERLRLQQVLAEPLRSRVNDLTIGQLVALRFASDAELPSLVARALSEKLSKDDVKKAVTLWRADFFRV